MPDTGAPWNIPYVAGTDLVADWPTDSQTLAEAIADGLDDAKTIRQIVTYEEPDSVSVTISASGGTATLTDFEATITPTSATSKVLVIVDVSGGTSADNGMALILKRDGTALSVGTVTGSQTPVTGGGLHGFPTDNYVMFSATRIVVDSPATTSAVTYTVDVHNFLGASQTLRLNQGYVSDTGAYSGRSASRLILIEVAA